MERHEKLTRHLLAGGMAVAVVALAAACASGTAAGGPSGTAAGPTSTPDVTTPASTSPATTTPPATAPAAPALATPDQRLALLATWHVTGQGIDGDTWLRLLPGVAAVWRDCGLLEADWALGPTTVVAWPHQWDTACDTPGDAPHEDQLVPWLTAATTYRDTADGWQLLGADGTALATLTTATPPAEATNRFAAMADPAGSYDATFWTEDPAAVPAGMTPATTGDAIGRWAPKGATTPTLELVAGGTWDAVVCSSYDGHWALDVDGRLLVTSAGADEGSCTAPPLVDLFTVTTRLALDGAGHLVLLDHSGQTNAVLTRVAQ